MPFELLLALRLLRSSGYEKNISTMIKICFVGIIIGTFALTLVASIMNGFEKATYSKLQGVHADVIIDAHDKEIDYEKLKKVLSSEYSEAIAAFSPTTTSQVILENKKTEPPALYLCLLKAVDPREEPKVTSLGKYLISDKKDPWGSLDEHSVFVGQELAHKLNIIQGQTVWLLYHQEEILSNKITLDEKEVTVSAFIKTGFHDFDEHVIIASFDLLKQLNRPVVTQVAIKVKPGQDEQSLINSLKTRLCLDAYSWRDLYPPLIAALTLEKYAMILIFALIALVASLTIIALLFMYATQKRADIALLKTMGMKNQALTRTFILISFIITTGATCIGILLAAGATWLLNVYPFIQLPDSYYVTHLPAALNANIILSILLLSFFISLLAALVPAQKIRGMNVASVLKGLP
jgi:lipoprotein-releasing system permease protein